MRAKGARLILSYFHSRMRAKELKRCLNSQFTNQDQKAKKMLELTLFQVFSGLDESKKAKKPTLNLF
jgi:hypothetical protein